MKLAWSTFNIKSSKFHTQYIDHQIQKIIFYFLKAMNILGFPTSQTFESTSYDEICHAFLNRSRIAMGTRKRAKSKMKAQFIY